MLRIRWYIYFMCSNPRLTHLPFNEKYVNGLQCASIALHHLLTSVVNNSLMESCAVSQREDYHENEITVMEILILIDLEISAE